MNPHRNTPERERHQHAQRYHQARLPLDTAPLHLMTWLARSGLFDPYVLYENGDEWSLAGGTLASVRLTGGEVGDLAAIEEQLAAVPVADWRAYGWATFELGAALAGTETGGDSAFPYGDGPRPHQEDVLLHLMVPIDEVRAHAGSGTVLVRSTDPKRLERLIDLLRQARTADGPPALDPRAPDPPERIDLPLDDTGEYRAAVAATLAELRDDGPLEKVIVSRQVLVPTPVDLPATYLAGRRANTPARSFLLDLGGIQAAGFSPETIAEVSQDGRVTTRPLAGTRARTGAATEDSRLRADLLSDPKEIHEHAVSVKLALEDIAAVCDDTCVSEYMMVQDRGTVQHLASTVTGQLRRGVGPWQAFTALFPAVTATGIPKSPAYRLIRALEHSLRGLYAGAVLTCDSAGNLDAALVLRSVFRRDGRCWLQAGAGVVRQSRPEREYEETCEKLRSVALHLVPAIPQHDRPTAPSGPTSG